MSRRIPVLVINHIISFAVERRLFSRWPLVSALPATSCWFWTNVVRPLATHVPLSLSCEWLSHVIETDYVMLRVSHCRLGLVTTKGRTPPPTSSSSLHLHPLSYPRLIAQLQLSLFKIVPSRKHLIFSPHESSTCRSSSRPVRFNCNPSCRHVCHRVCNADFCIQLPARPSPLRSSPLIPSTMSSRRFRTRREFLQTSRD
jgi:hypothetical protein